MKRVTLLLIGIIMITLWGGTVSAEDTRFVISGKTIVDRRTNLTWTRDANMGIADWLGASELIKKLNEQEYAGAKDWRLPNREELGTLVTYAKQAGYGGGVGLSSPYQLFNKIGFNNVQLYFYWSSSPSIDSTSGAWVINMYDGMVRVENKERDYYVWPVRGGK